MGRHYKPRGAPTPAQKAKELADNWKNIQLQHATAPKFSSLPIGTFDAQERKHAQRNPVPPK